MTSVADSLQGVVFELGVKMSVTTPHIGEKGLPGCEMLLMASDLCGHLKTI
jgi:hypothetical protein